MVRHVAARLAMLLLLVLGARLQGASRAGLRLPPGARGASFDHKSFQVGDRRTVLRCGGLHYFRVSPEEWNHRLRQTKLAGFNAVETPVPWNLHEPEKGTFRFDGIADLGQFLDQCREAGLSVVLRIGPYVNAAVTNGGLPAWLGGEKDLRVRAFNNPFLIATGRWWRRLLAVVKPRLAPAGPVVLVQLEDNYDGRQPAYLSRLYEMAHSMGVKVPVAVSTLHPLEHFGGVRVTPRQVFLTTKLLPAEPCQWGESRRDFPRFDDILFEGLAKGCDGYVHALWAAGTNVALLQANAFPTRFEAASSGLLEGGGPSEVHAACKKANLFIQSFERVLAEAEAVSSHPLLAQAKRRGLMVHARGDGTTTLLFVKRRYGSGDLELKDEASGLEVAVPVSAERFRHVVAEYPVTPQTRLRLSTAQVLLHRRLGEKELLVVYAPRDSEVAMAFQTARKPAVKTGAEGLSWDEKSKQLVLRWRCREREARADFVFAADRPVHVVAVEESLVAETWFLDGLGLVVGAEGIGSWSGGAEPRVTLRLRARRARFTTNIYPEGAARGIEKFPGLESAEYDSAAGRIDARVDRNFTRPVGVGLREWETSAQMAEAAADFDDRGWRAVARPEPMGEAVYGWYRCTFEVLRAGRERLRFRNLADAITVYLNGEFVGQSATKRLTDSKRRFPHPASFEVSVRSGENVLAVLAKNWGRYRNASSYDVDLAETTGWGIRDVVLLGTRPLLRWRQREGLSPEGRRLQWASVPEEADGRPRWYRTTFQVRPHPARLVPRIVLKGLSHGALWVNGRFAGLHQEQGYETGHGYHVPQSWLRETNEVVVLEEDGRRKPERAEVEFDRAGSRVPLELRLTP